MLIKIIAFLRKVFLCVAIFFSVNSIAINNHNLDSLKQILKTSIVDTNRFHLLINIGQQYKNEKPDSAILYFNKALSVSQAIPNKKFLAIANREIGIYYIHKADYVKAIKHTQKALEINEALNNLPELAKNLGNYGNIFYAQGNYDKAIDYFNQSLEIARKIGDKNKMASNIGNIGLIYGAKGDEYNELKHYKLALELYKETKNKKAQASLINNIAVFYYESGDEAKSLEYLTKALEIEKELKNKKGITRIYSNLSWMYYAREEYDKALNYANLCLEIALEINYFNQIRLAYYYLSKITLARGEVDLACRYKDQYMQYKDSIYNVDKAKAIEEIAVQYETEKKEKEILLLNHQKEIQEIELLKQHQQLIYSILLAVLLIVLMLFIYLRYYTKKKHNKILEIKNNELSEINKSKNKFFSIFSHDIKNPFGVLVSLTDYLEDGYENLSEVEYKQIIKTVKQSAEQTYKLLESLQTWSETQTGRIKFTPQSFNINQLIQETIDVLEGMYKNKNIEIDFENSQEYVLFADKNMMAFIIRNLLNNAIKFSNVDSSIKIDLKKTLEQISISIVDTGIGINSEDLEKLFRIDVDTHKIGNSTEKGTGLGLIICKEFAELNNGQIVVESKINVGSKFTLVLPN